jgi:cytochrome c oxidase subunit IV
MTQPERPEGPRRRRGEAEEVAHVEQAHASVKFYWMIGAILAVVTAMEVAIFYIPARGNVTAPILIAMSTGKFLLVVMFFMHLKFDSKVFTALFLAGLTLAILMVTGLVVLYHYLPRFRV